MTEGGLLSHVAFKAMAADNFVCVRLFSTALGGGHTEVRKFLPGIGDELRRHLMYQGNSVFVLNPDDRIITTRYEAVEQSPRLAAAVVQMEEKAPEGLLQLRRAMKEFPAAGGPVRPHRGSSARPTRWSWRGTVIGGSWPHRLRAGGCTPPWSGRWRTPACCGSITPGTCS